MDSVEIYDKNLAVNNSYNSVDDMFSYECYYVTCEIIISYITIGTTTNAGCYSNQVMIVP